MEAANRIDERSVARELTLKLLYALDLAGEEAMLRQLDELLSQEGTPARTQRLALDLYQGVKSALAQVDAALKDAALNWQLSRMPVVDRAVLRLGAYELLHAHEVPPRVSINEAVELAKKYSTEKSGSFVNGVLDKVFQTHCPQKV